MNNRPPCFPSCDERTVGCHSTCTRGYKEWRKWKDEVNQKRYRELQAINDADALRTEGIKNVTRGNRE